MAYNLGSGRCRWAGWINVDLKADVADLVSDVRRLPMIESDSADAVAAIHVLEHFYLWEADGILKEWRRILKPGGKLIIEVPCLDKIFAYVTRCVQLKAAMEPFMTLAAIYGDPSHEEPAMMHKWGYFTEHLIKLVENAGMREIHARLPKYHFAFRDMRIESIK